MRPTNHRRRYSDRDRATALTALEANGGNVKRTARHLGIPRNTLQRWIDTGRPDDMGKLVEEQKGALADGIEDIVRALLNVSDEKVRRAGLLARVKAAAIAVDKMLLLRGQPVWIGRCFECGGEFVHHEPIRRLRRDKDGCGFLPKA